MKIFHILTTFVLGDFTQFYRETLYHVGSDQNVDMFADQMNVSGIPKSMQLMMNLHTVYELRETVNNLAGAPRDRRQLRTRLAAAFSPVKGKI